MALDCNDEWDNFCLDSKDYLDSVVEVDKEEEDYIPKCSDIYISTKTMIGYLSEKIDITSVFWKLKVMDYSSPNEGIIKKQIKISFSNTDEIEEYKKKIEKENIVEETILTQINTNKRFKNIRKITIGISKKDILSNRCKKKSAFYNCFVIILRLKIDNIFKEAHIKVFNTGKIEIPGVQSDLFLECALNQLVEILQKDCGMDISYDIANCETVLINSNFNCGFFLDREKFYDILKIKYNIHCSFDPCSYPGIMSKFYYNTEDLKLKQNGVKKNNKDAYISVSFMIFRTGSILIVGKCSEKILIEIYEFLKEIILKEYKNIYQKKSLDYEKPASKVRKIKKKNIIVNL